MFRRSLAAAAAALVVATMVGAPVLAQDPSLGPPQATPMAEPPSSPIGDGSGVRLTTDKGDIVIGLFNGSAPVASENFLNLVNAGFYDGLTFHRLVPGFVIQGGDPAGDGSGGPGYTIPDEPVVGRYGRGTVAMARTQAPNSQGSQFFIVLDDGAESALASVNTYDIFGRVVEGMDVVDAIAAMPTNGDLAVDPVKILSAKPEQVTLPPEPSPLPPVPTSAVTGDPDLEAMFPTEVNGQPFTAQSTNGTELDAQIPAGDELGDQLKAALALMGKSITDVSLGGGSVGDQSAGISITGFRVLGADAADIETNLLPILLGFANLQRTSSTLGGKTVNITTDGPESPEANNYYVYDHGDTAFVVQGTEPFLTDALTKLP